MFDYATIKQQVIDSIETDERNSAKDYDIDAIMDELRDMDIDSIDDADADTYWDIIARNALSACEDRCEL